MSDGLKTHRTAPGKRVHGALYLHAEARGALPEDASRAVARAAALLPEDAAWNVVKLEAARPARVSLLLYEPFDDEPFPALLESRTVDLDRGTVAVRSFRRSANPPILHRKELLLAEGDPRRAAFAALTGALEERGLFSGMERMGFRVPWSARLAEAGVRIVDHRIEETSLDHGSAGPDESLGDQKDGASDIARHRTAIARDRLSVPMQALLRHGLIDETTAVFDYGCGRGDDVRALREAGFRAQGWDPHHAPDAARTPASVVNLGYVINVIEDPTERAEVARSAWSLTEAVLAVAVMIEGRADVGGQQPYRDGFVTRRGTFQKYYRQDEFLAFLAGALDRDPVAIAPGLAVVFADAAAEQAFLAERHRRRPTGPAAAYALARRMGGAERTPAARGARAEAWRPILERLWARAVELGREPSEDELAADLRSAVAAEIGSVRRGLGACRRLFDAAEIEEVAVARADDLRVHFAMNLFRQRRYGSLPPGLQRDARAFFGGLAPARAVAEALLFKMAEPGALVAACEQAGSEGLGHMDDGALSLPGDRVQDLPPILRCFVGCAGWLYGDTSEAHVVEIDPSKRRIVLSRYAAFDESLAPELEERTTVDLGRQTVRIFAPAPGAPAPVLLGKGRLLLPDDPRRAEQEAFDAAAKEAGVLALHPRDVTRATLRKLGLIT